MPCPFIYSCNEKVTKATFNHFCKTKKRYAHCDVYLGNLDKKRPAEWNAKKGAGK